MKEISCCFSGHRQIPTLLITQIKCLLYKHICEMIKNGIKIFYSGGALGFDTYAAEMVLKAKKKHKDIQLIMAYPCKNQTSGWQKADIDKYTIIKDAADKYIYVSDDYFRGCMHKRNRYLVDNSSYCVCFLNKSQGGTAYTIKYAQKNGLKITNLAQHFI